MLAGCSKEDELTPDLDPVYTVGLSFDQLSVETRDRLMAGVSGERVGSATIQARSDEKLLDSLVYLFVAQYQDEAAIVSFLDETGVPDWVRTLPPGVGYGENVFVTPVVKSGELVGNLFVFHDAQSSILAQRMDYVSYEYTDVGYALGGWFLPPGEMRMLYMVAGGQATAQYYHCGTVDSLAVYFRYLMDKDGSVAEYLEGRSGTTCRVLYCDGITTTLPGPPQYGNPNAGMPSGGNGPWTTPELPGWTGSGGTFSAGGWTGGPRVPSSGGSEPGRGGSQGQGPPPREPWRINLRWPWQNGIPCPFASGCNGGNGGHAGGSPTSPPTRRSYGMTIPTLTIPHGTESGASNSPRTLSPRSGNCRWVTIYDVEDVSDYRYLGNAELSPGWGGSQGGYACRGIRFGNEAMGTDFAWSIRFLLEQFRGELTPEQITCLVENPALAAFANDAMEDYANAQTCDGRSGAEAVREAFEEAVRTGSCGGAKERMASLLAEEYLIDWGALNDGSCPCYADLYKK